MGYGDSGREAVWAIVNTLFGAAIISPFVVKTSPLDLWGNIKVPRIEYFESLSSSDSDGWFNTSLNTITPPTSTHR